MANGSRRAKALGVLLALLLTGCAGSPGESTPETTAASVSAETRALAGVYQAMFTEADMEDAPPRLATPQSLATLPWVQTLTLDEDASVTMHSRWVGGEEIDDTGSYAVEGDTLTIAWSRAGNESVYRFTRTDDTLVLRGDPETMPADELFAFTTLPWERLE